MSYSPTAHCFYNCLKRYIIDDLVKTHCILEVSLGMKILTILLIPWGIISATPPFREVNLIKNEISNLNNHERQRKIPDIETVISDEDKLEPDATRTELYKRSLFPQFRKDSEFSLDKGNNEDIANFGATFLNGFKLGKKIIGDIIQSFFKFISVFNSKEDLPKFEELNQLVGDIFKNKFYEIEKTENTKLGNAIVDNEEGDTIKSNKNLRNIFNLKNEKKVRKIDEEMLHSIIPQIIANENQRSSKLGNNEHSDKSDNDEFETKQRKLYSEAPNNVLRTKRDTHIRLCNTLNKDSKNCLINLDRINVVAKNKQPSIVESSNTDLSFTKIIQKANAEAKKFNEFQIEVPDGEFSKWLDDNAEYSVDYPKSLNTSPKYESTTTNIKATSTETPLNKKTDKSVSIKTYIESDYKDLNLKWPNDEEYEFNKDLKKSPRIWQDDSVISEAILMPSEWDLIDKTTNNNNNAVSNANSISKTTASRVTNLEAVSDNKDIYIPSDWIVKYKMMSDKNDDILFSKVDPSAENHAGTNSRTEIVREDEYKPLKSIQKLVQTNNDGISRSGTGDAIFKPKQVIFTATEAVPFVSEERRKLSMSAVDHTIVSDKNNIAVATKSTAFTKANAGNVAISEDNQKLTKWDIKNAIISDKNTTISNDKAAVSATVYPASGASNESKRESSQNSMKNNMSSNQISGISKIEIKADTTVKEEARVPKEDKNEQLKETVAQKTVLSNKNNSAIVEEGILSKTVNSGVGVIYPAENSDIYEIQVPSEWIVKYESLNNKDDSLKFTKVVSANLNARNNAGTENASNWTNEPKVTRERDDKWSTLETNGKNSAVQAIAVSTEKTEKLPNERVKDNVQINKVLEFIKTDAEAATVNNNDKEQWSSNEKVQSLNSQSAAFAAANVKVAITTKREKEQWKWNDTDKDLIIKNNVKSENRATTSAEINTNVAGATHNKNRQWNWNTDEKTESTKDDAILNTKTAASAAGNSKAAASAANNSKFVTATQSGGKQWNWIENNRVANMKNYDISNNERTTIVEDTYDAEKATTDKKLSWTSNEKEKYSLTSNNQVTTTDGTIIEEDKQKWKWDNILKDLSVKDNVLLNNRGLTVTDNIATADTESEIQRRIWNNENKILSGKNVVASNNEAITTVGVSTNSESVIEDDKQQKQWGSKENTQTVKENGSSKNVTISIAKANANATESTISNKKTWKWDRADEVSSDKYDNLTANETGPTSETDVMTDVATDTNKKLLKLSDKNENLNEKENVTLNNEATASARASIYSQAAIEDENLRSIWDNKEIVQIIKNNGSSNGETISSAKVNANTAKSTLSNKRAWQWDRADEVSNDKYDYLTTNERDSPLEADIKAAEATDSNKKLLKLNDKNENPSEKRNITSNSEATATAQTNTNFQATIEDINQKWEWDNKENVQIVRNDDASKSETILSAKAYANAAETSTSNNQTWKWERADEVSSDKYGYLTTNKRDSSSGADVKAANSTDSNRNLLKLNNKNENLKEKESIISNSTATASTKTNVNSQEAIKDENLQSVWDNKENAQIQEDDSSKSVTISSAKANVNAAESTLSNKKTWKWDRADEISSDKYDYLAANERDPPSRTNVTATAITVDNKKLLKLNDKNENLNEKENITSNNKTITSIQTVTDIAAILENSNNQWDINNKSIVLKDNLMINNQSAASAVSNANATLIIGNNTLQSKLNNENNDPSIKNDVTSNNKATGSAEADIIAAVTTESEIKQKKLEDKDKNLDMENNISVNNKTTMSAEAKTNAATIMTEDQQQWWLANENKDPSIKDYVLLPNEATPSTRVNADAAAATANSKQLLTFNDKDDASSGENDDILNLESAAFARANGETADTTASYENQRILDNRNKNPRFKVGVTSNTEKAASARTDEEIETEINIMINNDNRKIFDKKTSEVSTLESISETLPSIIDIAEINLEKKYGMADTSVSSVTEIETDSINEKKEKLQSLELKNNNDNFTTAAETFANTQIESSISKEKEDKPSNRNSTDNNTKDDIDEMTFTKAIAYTVNKGDVDTLSKEGTKPSEWKIKETNAQSHQDLVSHGKTTVSTTTQAKADSIMEDQNKPLKKKVEDNNSYNNELSIASVSTAAEVKVDPSIKIKDSQTKYGILKDTEINTKSSENTKTSTSAIIETKMDSVKEDKNKQSDRKIDSKNLMDNTNLKAVIETTKSIDTESNSTSDDIDQQIKWKYKDENNVNANNSVTNRTINNGNDDIAIISSKEEDIINSLNKTSNNLINWLIRWRSIKINAVESNKNERYNNTELNYWKLGNSNNGKYIINELDIPTTTDDKMKDSNKIIKETDDADLIVLKKPYGQENTIGLTYIKDSVTPMVIYRVIPISVFEQVSKLIKQWEIIYTEHAKPQV
ncbi:extracellular matrix-binding protein ebh-like [Vespula squamosa]|uniref:Extracellular matrix-binding protein ebh-like n=1 Tax=Vespula squamosa TaxID=30214 RepID=A0ABD1ZXM8_VESSQ